MLVRNERRDLARDDHQAREVSPGVIVEIGRTIESPGTYSARGVLDGTPVSKEGAVPPLGGSIATDQVHAEPTAGSAGPVGLQETMRTPANAQMHNLASASPQLAVALRAGLPSEAAHLHPPPLALTAGIQTLASNALQQTEKSNAAAEHDEETDPLRKEKDQPVRDGRKPRGR
jgi:hypothetical protein